MVFGSSGGADEGVGNWPLHCLLPFSAVLEVTAVDLQEVRMRAVETGLYTAFYHFQLCWR